MQLAIEANTRVDSRLQVRGSGQFEGERGTVTAVDENDGATHANWGCHTTPPLGKHHHSGSPATTNPREHSSHSQRIMTDAAATVRGDDEIISNGQTGLIS